MNLRELDIVGLYVAESRVFGDDRGFFREWFKLSDFEVAGVSFFAEQSNLSMSVRNVVRGLHYQLPYAQGKLVRVVSGSVLDVVVDLRASSPTLGRSVVVELSADDGRQLWIPPGFAHGFQVLSAQGADFLYKASEYWAPEHERCIRWDDPDLAVPWSDRLPAIVSDKDARGGSFRDAVKFP